MVATGRISISVAFLGLIFISAAAASALPSIDTSISSPGVVRFSKRFDLFSAIRDIFGSASAGTPNGGNGRSSALPNREAATSLVVNHPGVDKSSIDLYAAYAGAAYLITTDNWDCGVQCSRSGTEGTVIKYRWSMPFVTSNGYIALNPDRKIIVVAFRGSAEFGDWIEDFTTSFVDWPRSGAGTQVGMGFLEGYRIASPLIIRTVLELTATYPEYEIVATGHSLGGARATMFVADVSENHPEIMSRLHLYTYGQPKCGNKGFADYMDSLDILKIREVNRADITPHLPSAESGYHHFGTEVWVPEDNQYLVCQSGNYSMCSDSIPAFSYSISDHSTYTWL